MIFFAYVKILFCVLFQQKIAPQRVFPPLMCWRLPRSRQMNVKVQKADFRSFRENEKSLALFSFVVNFFKALSRQFRPEQKRQNAKAAKLGCSIIHVSSMQYIIRCAKVSVGVPFMLTISRYVPAKKRSLYMEPENLRYHSLLSHFVVHHTKAKL